jgi:hypothetical protein
MSTKKETTTKSTKPTYIAYSVRNNDEQGEGFWTRIGAAFPHKDGKGFNLLIDVVPLDGRITLRVQSEKTEKSE